MIDRLVLAAVMTVAGWNGLHPAPPNQPTSAELREKARKKSVSNLCKKPRKSKVVKELCQKWEK